MRKEKIPVLNSAQIIEYREAQVEDLTLKNALYELNVRFQDLSKRAAVSQQKLKQVTARMNKPGFKLNFNTLKYEAEKKETSDGTT